MSAGRGVRGGAGRPRSPLRRCAAAISRSACLRYASLLLVTGLATAACGDATGPESARVDGLDLQLTLTPSAVAAHESFLAELTIRNARDRTARLVSRCTAIAWIGVHRDGERVGAPGTGLRCYGAVTTFEIAPGEVLRREWTITAESAEGAALPRGAYTLRLEFEVDGLPDLEHELRVE